MPLSLLFGRKIGGRKPVCVHRASSRRLSVEGLDDRITPSCGCELPPSQISGLVYFDQNKDGFAQDTEPRLEGVTVTLTGRSHDGDRVNVQATTDAGGIFMFQGLDGGTYKLKVSTPSGYTPGGSSVGAFGGNTGHNVITGISIVQGQGSGAYNFAQVVHTPNKAPDTPGNNGNHNGQNKERPEKGNNGVGNGLDAQPPGNPPVNDGTGTSPGSPGKGALPRKPRDPRHSPRPGRNAAGPVRFQRPLTLPKRCAPHSGRQVESVWIRRRAACICTGLPRTGGAL